MQCNWLFIWLLWFLHLTLSFLSYVSVFKIFLHTFFRSYSMLICFEVKKFTNNLIDLKVFKSCGTYNWKAREIFQTACTYIRKLRVCSKIVFWVKDEIHQIKQTLAKILTTNSVGTQLSFLVCNQDNNCGSNFMIKKKISLVLPETEISNHRNY